MHRRPHPRQPNARQLNTQTRENRVAATEPSPATFRHDPLVTAPPGYELLPEDIDAQEFERLMHTARHAPDAAIAHDTLEQAVSLWHGDAYQEFVHEDWAMAGCPPL